MKNKTKILATVLGLLTFSALLITVIPIPRVEAQFVTSSWDYPDEYDQGIDLLYIYENSTGSWVEVMSYEYDETIVIEWVPEVGMKLRIYSFQNSTLTGADDTTDGKNYHQHSVIVKNNALETVFSQQNFTYVDVNDALDPLWYYGYDVVLNFLLLEGEYYTITILYEVYW